ncbi:Coiled-coil domain-containing protein 38 [Boothiomyces macroporosus]|uniref:Coiled-coil domain-containing protein 38 n=1 Tax=Boothiomyces macroporosus TaxID=261099 RepID=A0AAD5UC83_9FUNG|nr:Coiled-coil domain-containing protein 38 [Boothiomyces macroporosus]
MGGDSQEKMLDDLNHKVKEVYRRCLGDTDGDLSTLQMLTSIENRLEQLFEQIELMPPDKVEEAEKMKDKERRQRLREEKLEAQRALQEERVQRALERARAPVKKKTGKPVVFRSAPPQKKKLEEHDTKKKEEEDLEYYWS